MFTLSHTKTATNITNPIAKSQNGRTNGRLTLPKSVLATPPKGNGTVVRPNRAGHGGAFHRTFLSEPDTNNHSSNHTPFHSLILDGCREPTRSEPTVELALALGISPSKRVPVITPTSRGSE
jgi:hypothetical protein